MVLFKLGFQAKISRRSFSTFKEFYDSQSGKHVKFSTELRKHGVYFSSSHTTIPSQLASLQLGRDLESFGRVFEKIESSSKSIGVVKLQSAEELDKFLSKRNLPAYGISLDISGRIISPQSQKLIKEAKSSNLSVRCNLLDWDLQAADSYDLSLALSSTIGQLLDLDVDVAMLTDTPQSDGSSSEDDKKDALQRIVDESFAIDCSGIPAMYRFGFYSPSPTLQAYAETELLIKNKLVVIK